MSAGFWEGETFFWEFRGSIVAVDLWVLRHSGTHVRMFFRSQEVDRKKAVINIEFCRGAGID